MSKQSKPGKDFAAGFVAPAGIRMVDSGDTSRFLAAAKDYVEANTASAKIAGQTLDRIMQTRVMPPKRSK